MSEPQTKEQAIEEAWLEAEDSLGMGDSVSDYKDFFLAGYVFGARRLAEVEHERDRALATIDDLEHSVFRA